MQLLYVWIEEYKNIKKQGFNFGSEFLFKYKNEVLTIEDNPNYIEGFFGEHVSNVTAIVGKNGSGKSTVIEFIKQNFPKGEVNGITDCAIIVANSGKTASKTYENNGTIYIFYHESLKFNLQKKIKILILKPLDIVMMIICRFY